LRPFNSVNGGADLAQYDWPESDQWWKLLMATVIGHGGIKVLIFILVVGSGFALMAAHIATTGAVRWKLVAAAVILLFAIVVLANVE
jgi:hypothetical protein